jgi:hypothetical protein
MKNIVLVSVSLSVVGVAFPGWPSDLLAGFAAVFLAAALYNPKVA